MDALTASTPSRRVILLGASNLTRSFPTVVATARATWGEPVEIMAAMGHGRSYGRIRRSSGEKFLEFFPAHFGKIYKTRPPLPTAALVTDIGNDLLYGVPPERAARMGRAMPRSARRGRRGDGRHAIAGWRASSDSSEARFRFFRRLFFPRSTLTLADAQASWSSSNQRTAHRTGRIAKNTGNSSVESWYGFDPIHFKRRVECTAWPDDARRHGATPTSRSQLRDRRCGRPRIWQRLRRGSDRYSAFGAAQRNRAVDCPMARRSLSIEFARERAANRIRAHECVATSVHERHRAAKKFFAQAKFLAKTCCIISTNSYNYEQVTAVFACFNRCE